MASRDTFPVRIGWHTERPVSRQEAEIRVLRALATLRVPGIVKDVQGQVRSSAPSYIHDERDLKWQAELIAEDDPRETFRPDRRDLSDWVYALAWWTAIPSRADRHPGRNPWSLTREQKVIRWRSFGLADDCQPSFEWIGREMKRDPATVKRWYEYGIDRIWMAARVWNPGDGVVLFGEKIR